jgi:hypothetical protein
VRVPRSLRGRVGDRWERQGRPRWSDVQTIRATLEEDAALEALGLTPAPKFRQARRAGRQQYIRQWVLGCHFEWLNPR